jgi:hypothetical protein
MKKLKSIKGISLKYIQSILKIDPDSPSGLTWLFRPNAPKQWNIRYANNPAGYECTNQNGYRKLELKITYNDKTKNFSASRVIFLLHNGYLTKGKCIDHIDNNSLNNDIKNLREGTISQNGHNSKLRKDNTSGHKNVLWCKKIKKWGVQIELNCKIHYFGYFDNKEDAIKVAIAARKKLHGEFGRDE